MIVAIDLGSTHVKAVALDEGFVVAQRRAPAVPERLLDAAAVVVSEVVERSRAAPAGLALSGAMHTLLPVDEGGSPLGAATSWAEAAPGKVAGDVAALTASTGCPPWGVYHPARLLQLRRTDPAAFGKAARFVGLRDWLFHDLTGRWWTDEVTASTTGLLDLDGGSWSASVLDAVDLEPRRLPNIVAPTDAAPLNRPWADLPMGLPVVVGSVDGALIHTALGATDPGATTLSIGTTAALRTVATHVTIDRSGATWCYRMIGGSWLIGTAINNGGGFLDRVRAAAYPDLDTDSGFERLLAAASASPNPPGVDLSAFLVPERDGTSPAGGGMSPEAAGPAGLAAAAVAHLGSAAQRMSSAVARVTGPILDPWITGMAARRPPLGRVLADALGIPARVAQLPDPATVGAAILGYEALGLDVPPIDRSARTILTPSGDRPPRGR